MNLKITFLLLTLIGIISSCKSKYKIQAYSLSKNIQTCDICKTRKVWNSNPIKSIILISDSTLNYVKSYGGIGVSKKIKYKISNDTLNIDTIDIYGQNLTEKKSDFSKLYLINKDSLTSLENDEKYYSSSFQKRKTKKFEPFYLIMDDQKIKLDSQRKAIRKLKKLIRLKREWTEMDSEIAKSEYGIPTECKTYKVNK